MRLFTLIPGLAATLLILAGAPASAEVFRCKMPDGRMAYQDVACPENGDQKVVAPSRIKPPPPRPMTEQDYYDQREAYKSQQLRYREKMQAEQLARKEQYAKPYVAGIGESTNGTRCMDDTERRKMEVLSGAYKHATSDAAIARRRAEMERCSR